MSKNRDLIEMLEIDLARAIELRDEIEDDSFNGGDLESELGVDVDVLNEKIEQFQSQIDDLKQVGLI